MLFAIILKPNLTYTIICLINSFETKKYIKILCKIQTNLMKHKDSHGVGGLSWPSSDDITKVVYEGGPYMAAIILIGHFFFNTYDEKIHKIPFKFS
jgi:hypothetical protein